MTTSKRAFWICKCVCGTVKSIESYPLRHGITVSCGCYNKEIVSSEVHKHKISAAQTGKVKKDVVGQRFGLWTVLETLYNKDGTVSNKSKCRCDCGTIKYVTTTTLRSGKSQSCGCVPHERSRSTIFEQVGLVCGTNVSQIANSTPGKTNTSGVKGVCVLSSEGAHKYEATITFQGKTYRLGKFSSLEEAAKARRSAEVEVFGEFIEWYNQTYQKQLNTYRD